MNPWALAGIGVGALLGTAFFGALFGWIAQKVLRIRPPASTVIGLCITVGLGTYGAADTFGTPIVSFFLYAFSAAVAFFIIEGLRARDQQDEPEAAAVEPSLEAAVERAVSVPQPPAPPPRAADPPAKPESAWRGIVRRLMHVLYLCAILWAVGFGYVFWRAGANPNGAELVIAAFVLGPLVVVAALHYIALGFRSR